jgi:hypothetical protein
MLSHVNSFLVIPLSILYAVQLLFQLSRAPNNLENEIVWSVVGGPFAMTLKCVSPRGCLVSNHWKNASSQGCRTLQEGEDMVTHVDYHHAPHLGLSILALPADKFEPVAKVSRGGMCWCCCLCWRRSRRRRRRRRKRKKREKINRG